MQIAYDANINTLYGFEMYLNYAGLVEGMNVDTFFRQKFEMLGYDLPPFYYDVGDMPGETNVITLTPTISVGYKIWPIVVFSTSIILIMNDLIRKRKK